MKKILSKTALTLVELIVSLALVSVVLLGIFSINMVLSNNNVDYGQRYLVRSQTHATLNNIINNAFLAVGSGTNITLSDGSVVADQGILIGAAMNDPNSFCIHQSPAGGPIWACYTFNLPASNQISYCTMPYTNNPPYRGAASCNGIANSQFLGTVYTTPVPLPTISPTGALNITLMNCLNDSATGAEACSATGTSGDMVNNPEVTVTGSAFSSQQGSG